MYKELAAELRLFETVCKHSDKPDLADLARRAANAIEELSDIARTTETIIENEKDMRVIAKAPRWIPVTEENDGKV